MRHLQQKLFYKGTHSLSPAELLALLIKKDSETKDLNLAHELMSSCNGSLNQLYSKTAFELSNKFGLCYKSSIFLKVALELGKRKQIESQLTKNKLVSSRSAYEILAPKMAHLRHEEFWVVFLNASNAISAVEKFSQGGIDSALVDIRIILKRALDHLSPAFILAHNHPSNSLEPSAQDIELTHRIQTAANLLDIRLMDHLIIAPRGYISLLDEGLML